MSEILNYIQLLQQPEYISKTDVQLFHNWVNDYPFVPVYRVLLAAKYQSLNHSDTAQYIEQAAFYVQDRKQLKHLLRKWSDLQEEDSQDQIESILTQIENEEINEVEPAIDSIENEITQEEEVIVEKEKEELVEVIEESKTLEEVSPIIEEETPKKESLETIEEIHQEAEIITETIKPSEEEVVESTTVLTYIEEEYISEEEDIEFLKAIEKYEVPVIQVEIEKAEWILEAPGNIIPTISENDTIDAGLVNTDISYLMPWINEFEFNYIRKEVQIVAPVEIKSPTVTIEATPINTKEKIKLPEIFSTKEALVEEKPVPIKETTTTNHSFDEWLSILEQKKNEEANAPVFDLPSPAVFTEKELAQGKTEPIISENFSIQGKDSKGENEDVKQLAADSISYKNDMGTETLAKLYVLQGKTDLAISIYQKLMVKFPEKNSYFASQIQKIKK
jgi:hypothetical protein